MKAFTEPLLSLAGFEEMTKRQKKEDLGGSLPMQKMKAVSEVFFKENL